MTERLLLTISILAVALVAPAEVGVTANPANPEIGETVTFRITGADGPISRAAWFFGGPACPDAGYTETVTCTLPDLFDCTIEGYSYATAGTKVVTVAIDVGGETQPAVTTQVVVTAEGSCPEATPCAALLDPEALAFGDVGGTGTVTVTTVPGCEWWATESAPWISLQAPAGGVGNGQLSYTVAINHGDARSAVVTVAGKSHLVSQAADPCAYQVEPSLLTLGTPGGTASFTVLTDTECHWTPSESSAWLHVIEPGPGGGPGVVTVAVDPIPGEADRQAEIDVHGALCTVFQQGYPPTDFTISDPTPEVGQEVLLEADPGLVAMAWHLGRAHCSGADAAIDCASLAPGACDRVRWSWSEAGPVTVSLTSVSGVRSRSLVVVDDGECCRATAPPEVEMRVRPDPAEVGERVQFSVVHRPEGSDDVKSDDPAAHWQWRVSLDGEVVVTSSATAFSHVFTTPGTHVVQLTARNCFGTGVDGRLLAVVPPAPTGFAAVIPAAVHGDGLNGTRWRSDLRFFNPTADPIAVDLRFLPEGINNHDRLLIGRTFELGAGATRIFADVVEAIPSLAGDSLKGTLEVVVEPTPERSSPGPIVSSRTYTIGPGGACGEYLPTLAEVDAVALETSLTGLVENDAFRTNLGVVNLGPDDAPATLVVSDLHGVELGRLTLIVPGRSSSQVVQILAGLALDPADGLYSVRLEAAPAVAVTASVVDNRTGDAWMSADHRHDGCQVHIPGVAHTRGVDGALWRTDVVFHNAADEPISARVEYRSGDPWGDRPFIQISNMPPGEVYPFVDVVGALTGDDSDSVGYLVVTPRAGSVLPRIAARTYTDGADGGTVGQGLKAFCPRDVIPAGRRGFIAGVTTSVSAEQRSRVNLGLLNVDSERFAVVDVALLDESGTPLGSTRLGLGAGRLVQRDLMSFLALDGAVTGSVVVEVVDGGAVAAYASEVDEDSRDPIMIPARVE